jgi:hypothetical protein
MDTLEAAELIAGAYDLKRVEDLSVYFLDRKRHYPPMDILNKAGMATPYDKDGDLMPALVMGMRGLEFPDGRGLRSMCGEIGGSAEWAVGVLPLTWRGGQAIGMLTSQSSLTRKDLPAEQLWRERFNFNDEEFMLMQDARFQRKPYFTVDDIVEEPFAGGISAFGAITDNYFVPEMKGVSYNEDTGKINVSVFVINSLGMVDMWEMKYTCRNSFNETSKRLTSPKVELEGATGKELEKKIGDMLGNRRQRDKFQMFFNNEYYPALIPVYDRAVVLTKALDALIERGALNAADREIVNITQKLATEWFMNSD